MSDIVKVGGKKVTQHYAGESAWFEVPQGFVSCKVIEVSREALRIEIKVGAYGYGKGERLRVDHSYVTPKTKVKAIQGKIIAVTTYVWETE